MRNPRYHFISLIAVLGLTLVAAGPASAAHHGKASHHKTGHHRSATTAKAHIAPSADPTAPPQTAASSAAAAPLRGGIRPVNVGDRPAAMETGTWQQGDDDPDGSCQRDVDNANMWQEQGDYWASKGDKARADQAYDAASTVAGEANQAGCTIFLMED
jgi:hypothetical protein